MFSISQRWMLAHKSSASKIDRNGNGKLVFKLDPLVSGQTFTLVTPDLSVPGISLEVLQRVLSQASTASCVMAAPSPHRFFAAWRVEALFLFFPISMGSTFGGPFDSRFYFV